MRFPTNNNKLYSYHYQLNFTHNSSIISEFLIQGSAGPQGIRGTKGVRGGSGEIGTPGVAGEPGPQVKTLFSHSIPTALRHTNFMINIWSGRNFIEPLSM